MYFIYESIKILITISIFKSKKGKLKQILLDEVVITYLKNYRIIAISITIIDISISKSLALHYTGCARIALQ